MGTPRLVWAALAAVTVSCGGSGNRTRQLGASVQVAPGNLDFGEVALGLDGRSEVLLRNQGLIAATVDQLPGAGDDVFALSTLPVVLQPGQEARVPVAYRPRTLGTDARSVALVALGGTGGKAGLELQGRAVRGLVSLQPSTTLDFSDVVLNEAGTAALQLVNDNGSAASQVTLGVPTGPDAAAFSCGLQGIQDLAAHATLTVRCTFRPSRLGAHSASLAVTPCPTCSPQPLALAGNSVLSLIAVQPAALDFGEVRLGASPTRGFTLTNTSRRAVTVTALRLAGDASFTAAFAGASVPAALAPGQSLPGTVTFHPLSLGQQASSITFVADDGAPAVLAAKGLGMGPVLKVTPDPIDAGPVALGTTRRTRVVVQNAGLDPHGVAPLQITNVVLKSADAGWALDAPVATWAVGAPGQSVQWTLSYSPTRTGWSSATISIDSNDDLHPHVDVPVQALARDLLPCSLQIVPSPPVDFGRVPVFHPSVQGYELTNQTRDDCIVGDPELSGDDAFRWPGGVAPAGRTLPPGGRMSVRVEFTPAAAGLFHAQVSFYLSNKAQQTMTVALQGTGDAGCFFVTPGAVDFGGIVQGCSTPVQHAYAVNQCSGPVTVTDVHTTGAPFFLQPQAPATPFTLQPNTSADLPIAYQPTSVGDDVGILYVSTTTSGATPYQAGLTGGSHPNASVTDQWDQSTPKVDLLFVIDNSGSADDEQAALASNLDRLWNRIALANADFHIAVTTTGMEPFTSGWTQCPGGAAGGEAGRFFPVDNSHPRLITPRTADPRGALQQNVNVGLCHWDERFLDPVVAALTEPLVNSAKAPGTPWPSDGDAGFLRDDARLALFVVSDSDDDNDVFNPPPVSDAIQKIVAAKHGAKDLVSFAGLVPLSPCLSAEQYPVPRYLEIARELGGHLYDSCNFPGYGQSLEDAAGSLLLPLTSFPLSLTPRDPSNIQVTVSGQVSTAWTYDAASNRIVFPASAVPPPGSHIVATYEPGCR